MKLVRSRVGLVGAAIGLGLCTGCEGGVSAVGSPVGKTRHSTTLENALSPNALLTNSLVSNSLVSNSLVSNSLVSNSLVSNSIVSNALSDPSAQGDATRLFFRYLVGCALNSSQTASFSWTDSDGNVHDETYSGALGLGSSWADEPLDEAGQRWVTACLLARTNYFGISVVISMRGPVLRGDPFTASIQEVSDYADSEGAFWGNLFAPNRTLYACTSTYNASDQNHVPGYLEADQRVCTVPATDDGGNPSGFTQCGFDDSHALDCTGACSASVWRFASSWSAQAFYNYVGGCTGSDGVAHDEVVTTALYGTP
ncbi:MAG TPA: hypothetical protein VKN99_22460 [Polyangia bacterium]|nr:hypothetical protein [Polyangia bacterium]